jgi:uncharacterized membrane protein
MVKALVAASLLWPIVLGTALWQRSTGAPSIWSSVVYLAGSAICHQRPERTFQAAGAHWPVCGRCSGLYLAAPAGAVIAVGLARRPRRRRSDRSRHNVWLAAAAVPTVVTFVLEWLDLAPVSNLARFFTALPLGAAVALVVVSTAAGPPRPIEYTFRR